jgi:predicted MPP superfamily phosphohydrolase
VANTDDEQPPAGFGEIFTAQIGAMMGIQKQAGKMNRHMAPVSFYTFRLIIVSLAVFAQVYLFLRFRKTIRSSHRSGRFKTVAVALAGGTIGLLFIANWHIMYRPIPWPDPPSFAQALFFYAPAVWSFGSIFSALLLLATQLIGGLAKIAAGLFRRLAGPATPQPADPGRRRFLKAGVGGLAAAPFMLSGYGAAHAGKNHTVEEFTLPFGCPVRVVQLTDIHAGIFMTRETMGRYARQVMALRPQLFVLTGDYISNSTVFFQGFVEEMARVKAPYGTFATLGNHEHWYGEAEFFERIFNRHGIHLLQNAHQIIQTGGGPFAVAGIDDLRWGRPDLDAALRGLDPAVPTILLSHRPEIFPRAAKRGIPLTLAGHYHGGQVKLRLPGGDFSLAHLRTPYPEGLYRIETSCLYVSRGIGTTFTPVRLNAPPEVTLFHLT